MLNCCQQILKEDFICTETVYPLPADPDVNLSLAVSPPTLSNKTPTCLHHNQISGCLFQIKGYLAFDEEGFFCGVTLMMCQQAVGSRNVKALTVTRHSFWEADVAWRQEGSRGEVGDLHVGLWLVAVSDD